MYYIDPTCDHLIKRVVLLNIIIDLKLEGALWTQIPLKT